MVPMSGLVPNSLPGVVELDVEATKKMLAEPEPAQYEDLEPDYEYLPAPWCNCHCH